MGVAMIVEDGTGKPGANSYVSVDEVTPNIWDSDIRQALISARAVIHTAIGDTPQTLQAPERSRVLQRTAGHLTAAIAAFDQLMSDLNCQDD